MIDLLHVLLAIKQSDNDHCSVSHHRPFEQFVAERPRGDPEPKCGPVIAEKDAQSATPAKMARLNNASNPLLGIESRSLNITCQSQLSRLPVLCLYSKDKTVCLSDRHVAASADVASAAALQSFLRTATMPDPTLGTMSTGAIHVFQQYCYYGGE